MLKIVETRSSSNKNAEQTSNIYLSKEDIEKIKASVITNVINVLLELIEEIISLVVEKSQILTNTNLEKVIENYRQITPKSNNTSDDVNDFFFFFRNKDKWRQELRKHKYCYYNFFRCDQLILLYNEYLEGELIHISPKFRNDDICTMN